MNKEDSWEPAAHHYRDIAPTAADLNAGIDPSGAVQQFKDAAEEMMALGKAAAESITRAFAEPALNRAGRRRADRMMRKARKIAL